MGFKPYLKDQLVSFSALTLLVWSYDVKIVPEMTYNVSSVTLSLYTTTALHSYLLVLFSQSRKSD